MNKNRIIKFAIIGAIFAVIGILIIVFNKFEYNINYSKNVRFEIDLGRTFEIGEIVSITNEVFENQMAMVRSAGATEKAVAITVRDFTGDQSEALITKINEKYGTSLTVADMKVYYNSNVKGKDLIAPYIIPSIFAGVIILVFFGIRYRKLGVLKALGCIIGAIFGTELLYMVLSSIFKMEINEVSIAGGVAIAIFSLTYISLIFEKKLQEK